jgi:hypothetical protein
VDRLTEAEYGEWRQRAATQKVRQYWRDYRQSLMERWAAGEKLTDAQQAYAQILGDLEGLTFQDIEKFYESLEEPRDDGEEPEQSRD